MAKDTKQRIIQQAAVLFQKKGYDTVGVREIAKAANCSHTALYLYFKTKEEILFEVAKEPLNDLVEKIKTIQGTEMSVSSKIIEMCHTYIIFGFEHRDAYQLLFLSGGERVDAQTFQNPVSPIRIESFNLLKANIDAYFFAIQDEEKRLNITRGIFLFLHGFVHLYSHEKGVYDRRLKKIVDDYISVMILEKDK